MLYEAKHAAGAPEPSRAAAVEESLGGYAGEVVKVTERDAEGLEEFRNLKEGRAGGVAEAIVAEGPEGIRLLLASGFEVKKYMILYHIMLCYIILYYIILKSP